MVALLRADAELGERLIPELRVVAGGRNTSFFTTEQTNPWAKASWSKSGSHVLSSAQAILREARLLEADSSGLVAAAVVAAFTAANDLAQEQRLGPIRLAQELLTHIEGLRHSAV